MLSLYTYPGNTQAIQTLIAAEYNQVDVQTPPFEMGTDNKTPDFVKKQPLEKVPLLDTPHGTINEPNAIARYVARLRPDTELLGRTFFEQAIVDQWIEFAKAELELPVGMWIYPILGFIESDDASTNRAKQDLKRALTALNNHLLTHSFLVGDSVTLADIVVACALLNPFKLVFDATYMAPFSAVVRWFRLCVDQPSFVAVLGFTNLLLDGGETGKAGAQPASAPAAQKAVKEGKAKEGKKENKGQQDEKTRDKKKPPTDDKAEKLRKKVIKEGGKKGVEIEGASDMGGRLYTHGKSTHRNFLFKEEELRPMIRTHAPL